MKNKLTKKFVAFLGTVIVAGSLMVVGNTTEAYANCIDKNTVKPSGGLYEAPGIVMANGGLNIRRGPGINYSKIGWVGDRESIKILQEQDGWVYIKYNTSNGCKVGWGSDDYIYPIE